MRLSLEISPSKIHQGRKVCGQWIADLVHLGAALHVWHTMNPERFLTVGVSAPHRDFVALLIASGWSSTLLGTELPLERYGSPAVGQRVSVSVGHRLLNGVVNSVRPNSIIVGQRQANTSSGFTWVQDPDNRYETGFFDVPPVGPFIRHWDERKSELEQAKDWCWGLDTDVTLVGTESVLRSEASSSLRQTTSESETSVRLELLCALRTAKAPSHRTSVVSARNFENFYEMDGKDKLVVFDGNEAANYFADSSAPIKVVILDRSIESNSGIDMLDYGRDYWSKLDGREVCPPPISKGLAWSIKERQF